jgi:hypothetical protein
MGYECLRCGFEDQQVFNVKRHLNRKNLCEPTLTSISKEDCLKVLKTKDYKLATELLLKEIENLRKASTINSGNGYAIMPGENNTANIDNSVTINITVNSYENTNYSGIKDKLDRCIENGKVNEAKLLKILHFDKDHPENHNVKIDNIKDNRIMTYNGEKFEQHKIGKDGVWEFIGETLDTASEKEGISDNLQAALDGSGVEYYNMEDKRKKVSDVSTVLYNGKEIVNKTHK